MCRWPIGDPRSDEFRYCGAPAAKSWCAHHHAIAYQSDDDRDRWDRRRTLGLHKAA
jgi:GcrA cell cycle regulator